jgi:molecular chaperone DnaJ
MASASAKPNFSDLSYCPYEVLGLQPFTPTNSDISSAFRKMSLKWHPDRNKAPNAKEMFMRIKEASMILLSESDRKNYDQYLKLKREA